MENFKARTMRRERVRNFVVDDCLRASDCDDC